MKSILLTFILALTCLSQIGKAESDYSSSSSSSSSSTKARSRFSLEFERFKGGDTASGTEGLILGARYSRYLYRGLSIGWEIKAGSPRDGSIANSNLFSTGLTMGWDHSLLGILYYDFSGTVGYGFGSINSAIAQSVVLNPTANIGVIIINGFRLSFGPGYYYMPGLNNASGMTFGLRFEHKVEVTPGKPVDN